MKKLLPILLALALLLSACAVLPEPEPPSTPPVSKESAAPAPVEPTLMNSRRAVGADGTLWYLPNDAVEGMQSPEMRLFEDSLLLYTIDYDGGCTLRLRRVSLLDGTLLAAADFPCGGAVTIQLADGRIGLCDSAKRRVLLLDSELRQLAEYSLVQSGESWYLSRDLSTLYIIDWQSGLNRVTLATGETTALLSGVTDVFVRGYSGGELAFSYSDGTATCRVLDLATGELRALPDGGDAMSVQHAGEAWLLGDAADWSRYRLMSGGETKDFFWKESRIDLLSGDRLMTVNLAGDTLCLYDLAGGFLSRAFAGENSFCGRDVLRSDLYDGYFFLCFTDGSVGKLYFWDTQAAVSGEDFVFDDGLPEEHGGVSADAGLYERAAALSETYGVAIRIADQCEFENNYYDFYEANDRAWLTAALDTLNAALGSYPKNFFVQLSSRKQLRLEIVASITPKAGAGVGATAAAFTQSYAAFTRIVFDVYFTSQDTVFHELSHVIDAYLQDHAQRRTDALFSETDWAALNPAGFDYAYSYESDLTAQREASGEGYFYTEYAMTFPTEDRATLMAAAMTGYLTDRTYWSGLLTKLDYYSRCIRDTFDTTGWPQTTLWEAPLR